jgi:hypothetical protein
MKEENVMRIYYKSGFNPEDRLDVGFKRKQTFLFVRRVIRAPGNNGEGFA